MLTVDCHLVATPLVLPMCGFTSLQTEVLRLCWNLWRGEDGEAMGMMWDASLNFLLLLLLMMLWFLCRIFHCMCTSHLLILYRDGQIENMGMAEFPTSAYHLTSTSLRRSEMFWCRGPIVHLRRTTMPQKTIQKWPLQGLCISKIPPQSLLEIWCSNWWHIGALRAPFWMMMSKFVVGKAHWKLGPVFKKGLKSPNWPRPSDVCPARWSSHGGKHLLKPEPNTS